MKTPFNKLIERGFILNTGNLKLVWQITSRAYQKPLLTIILCF